MDKREYCEAWLYIASQRLRDYADEVAALRAEGLLAGERYSEVFGRIALVQREIDGALEAAAAELAQWFRAAEAHQ